MAHDPSDTDPRDERGQAPGASEIEWAKWYPRLVRWGRWWLGNLEDAQDAAGGVFLRFIPKFRDGTVRNPRSYLFTAMARACVDVSRRRLGLVSLSGGGSDVADAAADELLDVYAHEFAEDPATRGFLEKLDARRELDEVLRELGSFLNDEQFRILRASVVFKSRAKAAAALGMSHDAYRQRLSRIRADIREHFRGRDQ